jgi:hypothetical protein
MKKKILLGVVVVLVVLQFFRPERNLGATEPGPNDVTVLYPTSPEVKAILAKACYDCHSDHTRYPWYANIQPVGWWLANHVKDGKRHLNFSQFAALKPDRAARKMGQVVKQVTDEDMPLTSYTLIHRDADLTAAETKSLNDWADSVKRAIAAKK